MKYTILPRALALLFLAAAPAAIAQTPAPLNYQGRVQTGTPPADFTGTGQFKFALVDQSPVPFVRATATVVRAAGVQSLVSAVFTVTNGGSGYATAPAVTVSAPDVGGGVQATVTAVVSGGSVTGFTVVIAGSGYTSNPTLTIAPPPAPPPTIIWNNNGPAPADPANAVSLPVTNGLYSVLLGDTSIPNMAPFQTASFSRPDLRLRVWFNGTQLTPDQRLAPNGYLPSSAWTLQEVIWGNDKTIFLRHGGDTNHGIGFDALRPFNPSLPPIDGPVLYGYDGGALGIGANRSYALTWKANGNVGIGATPTKAKLEVNGAGGTHVIGAHSYVSGSGVDTVGGGGTHTNSASIWASHAIHAEVFRAYSDERIKVIQRLSDSGADLGVLRGIQVTDYLYKDTVGKGNCPQKKVIAQQVEKVFPQVVTKTTDVVPDIYQPATFSDGWVMLKTDLKQGERVRLTDDKTTEVFEVLEVTKGRFRTAFKPAGDKVFVYGREVNDFRTVDYEAIAMLNVSATQELARQLEAEKADTLTKTREIAALKERLAALEAKDAARDAKLAALVKLMEEKSGEAKAASVSTVSTQQ